jgi:hypothetical protein
MVWTTVKSGFQTGSETHTTSYAMDTGRHFLLGVKLTTHLHLAPRLGVHGAIPPLLRRFSWREACLCIGATLPYVT